MIKAIEQLSWRVFFVVLSNSSATVITWWFVWNLCCTCGTLFAVIVWRSLSKTTRNFWRQREPAEDLAKQAKRHIALFFTTWPIWRSSKSLCTILKWCFRCSNNCHFFNSFLNKHGATPWKTSPQNVSLYSLKNLTITSSLLWWATRTYYFITGFLRTVFS